MRCISVLQTMVLVELSVRGRRLPQRAGSNVNDLLLVQGRHEIHDSRRICGVSPPERGPKPSPPRWLHLLPLFRQGFPVYCINVGKARAEIPQHAAQTTAVPAISTHQNTTALNATQRSPRRLLSARMRSLLGLAHHLRQHHGEHRALQFGGNKRIRRLLNPAQSLVLRQRGVQKTLDVDELLGELV